MRSYLTRRGAVPARIVEWALCVCTACALCYTVQGGFNVSEDFHAAVPLHVAVCALSQALLCFGSASASRRLFAGVGYAAAALVACAAAVVASPLENPIADVPQNAFAAVVVYAAVNAVVHALARRHATCVVLFALGAFVCGLTQFLYTTNMLVATVVFLLSSLMLIALRVYADSAKGCSAQGMPLFAEASAVGVALPVAAGLLAGVVVLGAIMPLNPPHAVIKLFDEYVSYEEVQVKTGVQDDEEASKTITSSTVDESLPQRTTTDKKLDKNSSRQVAPQDAPKESTADYLSGDFSDVDLSGLVGNMQALALTTPIPWPLIIACIIVAALLLLTVPRFIVHRVRLRRIVSLEPAEQVRCYYRFFLGRFAKLGLAKPDALSPVEYANLFRARLEPFVGAQCAGSFDHLTALLVNLEFAAGGPGRQDLDCMKWMYGEFYRRCRKKFGLLNYIFRKLTL